MPLNAKQERFCHEYIIDLNATQAAIRAGYSEKTAQEQSSRLLSNVIIQKKINEAKENRSKSTGITAERVLTGIMGVIERCEKGVPVLDNDGAPTGEWRFEATPALRGYELLGKHLKLFNEQVDVNLKGELAEKLERALQRVPTKP
jgi:phage terminase small subunit